MQKYYQSIISLVFNPHLVFLAQMLRKSSLLLRIKIIKPWHFRSVALKARRTRPVYKEEFPTQALFQFPFRNTNIIV